MSRTYILNLLFLINYMCKVGQFCNVGSHAQQMCHTPSLMDIYTGKVGEIFIIITTHIFLSHQEVRATKKDESHPHVWKTKRTKSYGWAEVRFSAARVSLEVWPALTLVNAWSNQAENWWKVRFLKAVLPGTKIEVKGLTVLLLRWLLACCPCVDFSGQRWLLQSWLGLTHLQIGGLLWHMLGWLTKGDFAGWSILLTAETNTHIFPVSDLSSVRSAYMFYLHFA